MDDDRISVAQLVAWGLKLSDEDLRRAIVTLNEEYRSRVQRAGRLAALALKPGDWVEVAQESRKLAAGMRGHVLKIRRDRVDVHFADQEGFWTVTASMLRKVDGPAKK